MRLRRLTLATLLVALPATLLALGPGLLAALPVLLLFALLVVGCYPGEDAIVRLREARARPGTRRAGALQPSRLRYDALLPRGGALLAFRLAVRPPPVVLGPA